MKTWKRLVSGLFALVLLASLAGSALAAEAAKKEVPKPTGQFTQWFPWMGADPDAPEASEAVLAQMGTVINQTKTVGGETLTLNGALWEGDSVHLSFTAKSPHFPADLSKDSWVNSDKCTALMPEKQWMDYARKRLEAGLTEEDLAKEGLESRLQNAMKQGQAEFDPRLSVYSREGNTVCLMKVIMLMYSLPVAEDRHFLLNLLHIMYQLQSFRIAEYFAKVRPYIFVSFI